MFSLSLRTTDSKNSHNCLLVLANYNKLRIKKFEQCSFTNKHLNSKQNLLLHHMNPYNNIYSNIKTDK